MKEKVLRMTACLLVFAIVLSYSVAMQVGDAEAGSNKGVKKVTITNVQTSKITLGKGKSLKLATEVILNKGSKASKKVTFKSSNTSVATVNKSGLIKAKNLGKAKITVSSKANAKKKATITVSVAKKNLLIKKISLKKNLTLHLPLIDESDDEDDWEDGEETTGQDADEDDEEEDDDDDEEDDDDEITYALKAKVYPSNASNQNLKWTSSNKKVVTVDKKGVVSVVDAGKAVITVKATDGSKKKATCKITVVDDADEEDGDEDGDD